MVVVFLFLDNRAARRLEGCNQRNLTQTIMKQHNQPIQVICWQCTNELFFKLTSLATHGVGVEDDVEVEVVALG